MADDGAPRTFGERLEYLFRTVHPEGRRPFSLEEVASGIVAQGNEPVSAAYIWALRKGQRDNPTVKTVEALAQFFGVPTAYFFEDTPGAGPGAGLSLASTTREVAGRSGGGGGSALSPQGKAAVDAIVQLASEAVAKVVGLVAELDRSRPQSPSQVEPGGEDAGLGPAPDA
jgi:hypothetical protein